MVRPAGEAAPAAHDGQALDETREGSTGQHHRGWQARERSSAVAAAAGRGARPPLREAPGNGSEAASPHRGNGGSSNTTKNLRPYDIPYANSTAGSTTAASASEKVPGGSKDQGVTLRCMYTSQKTKKRKTWSDGAVKCCPKRQRVSLYRWSEALGVTDKLLGEIYLTVPQYEAFINQGEPELEMELFIVSLDGVIQSDGDPPPGVTSAADGAAAGVLSGGPAGAGRKRKLFKAFKPPARKAPSTALPPEDSSGLLPGRIDQLRNGDRSGDHHNSSSGAIDGGREVLPAHTSYTGFGHVESLWDDDDEEGEEEEQGRRGGGAESVGFVSRGNAGWGMGAGAGCRSAYDGSSGGGSSRAGMFPGAWSEGVHLQQQQHVQWSPTAVSAADNTSDWMWGQEDARPGETHNSSSSSDGRPPPRLSSRSARDGDGDLDFPLKEQERLRYEDPTHSGRDDPASYESFRNSDGGGETCPSSAGRSALRGGSQGVDGAEVGHRHYYGGHQQIDGDGSFVQAGGAGLEDRPFGRNAVSEHGAGARVPEVDRLPGGGGGGGDDDDANIGGKLRSTQDILSLFGGFGGISSPAARDFTGHGWQAPREKEAAATPLESRGSNNIPPELGGTGNPHVPAVEGGISRAADMRRAQKASRAAAASAAAAAAAERAATLTAANEEAGAASATSDGAASADWVCGVCGVRRRASSTSCRVCGAKRQAPRSGDVVGEGGDGHPYGGVDNFRGDLGVIESSDKQPGWGGHDFRGGEWEDQGWDGVAAGNDTARAGGVDGVDTVSLEGQGAVGRGRSSSPSRPASLSHTGDEGGSEGAAGSTPGSSSKHRMIGVRMQMDMGSSSDSDDA